MHVDFIAVISREITFNWEKCVAYFWSFLRIMVIFSKFFFFIIIQSVQLCKGKWETNKKYVCKTGKKFFIQVLLKMNLLFWSIFKWAYG